MAKDGPSSPLTDLILKWYDRAARNLPWRVRGEVPPDPYRVWLSEIMLQQTTVAAVRGYFESFLAKWPDVESLAAADLDDVLRAWAGLGYYARARNLHACARTVASDHGGRFPGTYEGLLALPGIGPYTAAAMAAIAFGKPHAAVDGNVERVISRVYAIRTPLPRSKKDIKTRAEALVPGLRAGDFAQAMMDLGATVCTPRNPACGLCPWTEHCMARAEGLTAELPARAGRRKVPLRRAIAFWAVRGDGKVLIRRRPEKGLLGGMMEFPSTPWREKDETGTPAVLDPPLPGRWRKVPGRVEHTFTHFRLVLDIRAATFSEDVAAPGDDYRWVAPDALSAEALPSVMRKIAAHMGVPMMRRS